MLDHEAEIDAQRARQQRERLARRAAGTEDARLAPELVEEFGKRAVAGGLLEPVEAREACEVVAHESRPSLGLITAKSARLHQQWQRGQIFN